MKVKHLLWSLGAFIGVVAVGLFAANATQAQDEPEVPEAHASITSYEGPQTCATCHPDAAMEMASSLHYQQQGPVPFTNGFDDGEYAGMLNTF